MVWLPGAFSSGTAGHRGVVSIGYRHWVMFMIKRLGRDDGTTDETGEAVA